MPRSTADKLLQLNLHQALEYAFQGFLTLEKIEQLRTAGVVASRIQLTDLAGDLNEALFRVCFHLNALSGGRYLELFSEGDKLRTRTRQALESIEMQVSPDSAERSITPDSGVTAGRYLGLVRETCGHESPEHPAAEPTACQLLAHWSDLLLQITAKAVAGGPARESRLSDSALALVPIDYAGCPDSAPLEADAEDRIAQSEASALAAAQSLLEGIREVRQSPSLPGPSNLKRSDGMPVGTVLYAQDTVTLYIATPIVCGAVAAGVFDSVAGNHIHLLIQPTDRTRTNPALEALLVQSLHWLEFDSCAGNRVISARIRNLTRLEMTHHLGMLGKLLAYVDAVGGELRAPEEVRSRMEYFLERIL